jgi:hypothetical protein
MARKPDDAFIERVTTVGDSISTATSEPVETLVADARSYGGTWRGERTRKQVGGLPQEVYALAIRPEKGAAAIC